MLVKYDLQIYKAEKRVFFMFTMDHSIEFVEKFVSNFYGIDQCKRIKRCVDGVSVNDKLIGKYYDCNNLHQLSNPKFIGLNHDFFIDGQDFALEFQVHDYNLNQMDYTEFVNVMRAIKFPEKYDLIMVFCSAEDELNRARYAGGVSKVNINLLG